MSLRAVYLAAAEDWKCGRITDGELAAATAAFGATDDGRAYLSGPVAPVEPVAPSGPASAACVDVVPGPAGPSSKGGAPMGMVQVDAVAFEDLKRRAAEAPALIAAAAQAQASPVRVPDVRPVFGAPAALSGAAGGEPSEAAWDGFLYGVGMGGSRQPREHFEVDTREPGGRARPVPAQLSAPGGDERWAEFTRSLNL